MAPPPPPLQEKENSVRKELIFHDSDRLSTPSPQRLELAPRARNDDVLAFRLPTPEVMGPGSQLTLGNIQASSPQEKTAPVAPRPRPPRKMDTSPISTAGRKKPASHRKPPY